MDLSDITTKNYILALVIRSDNERLLLGDGAFEFKEGQQHFLADTFANDVVELQGTDGQLLAGQVIRSNAQEFDGYIGDASLSKPQIEQYRSQFLRFFRKNYFYTVVYIFCDGSAIQRKRGYIVDAPAVPELWQRFPEWHVSINFEDPTYYEYNEDEGGQETYAHEAQLNLSNVSSGGLVWDNVGAVANSIPLSGSSNILNYDLPTQNLRVTNAGGIEAYEKASVIQWIKVANTKKYVSIGVDSMDDDAVFQMVFFDAEGHRLGASLTNDIPGQYPINDGNSFVVDKICVWATKDENATFENLRLVLTDTLNEPEPPYEDFIEPTTIDGFVWDAGGSGGPTTVTVPGVDYAKPIWEVPGQSINPTITNTTTGQSLTWTGTVPVGQTLIVDMNEMTATLEGANVFEFISGSWISLKPGNNVISYTADNEAPASTLKWNGVAG